MHIPSPPPFHFADTTVAATLRQLYDRLVAESGLFPRHVTPDRNDFAAWIHDALHDNELAARIGPLKEPRQILDAMAERLGTAARTDSGRRPAALPEHPTISAPRAASAPPVADPIPEVSSSDRSPVPSPIPSSALSSALSPSPSSGPMAVLRPADSPRTMQKPIEPTGKGPLSPTATASRPAMSGKRPEGDIDLASLSPREVLERLKLVDFSSPFVAVEEEERVVGEERQRLLTGVPGFDSMIPEGIPTGSNILVSGGPGSGKTTFCIQMLGHAARQGEKCLFLTFEESEERLIEHMEEYGFDPRKCIEEGTLRIERQDAFKVSRMVEALLAHARGELLIDIDDVLEVVPKDFTPDRVVLDSLSAVASAFSESSTAYRVYVTQLMDILQKTGATSFLISEVQGIENIGHGLVEEFLADGVIVFYNLQKRNVKQNALEILKMRSVDHEKKIVPFEFVKGQGIVVYPLERTFM